ncbi:SIR2 family protein [Novosphingobium sp. APW14]|uniref:SIR2 family protein n=1 Tax=Novosphingobium sp. APW14 TaxID=3077237 RepID=UPI0028E014ED|nr:SIR2 family protein [Novosphingobium sp. APW14]MDT9013475.1 SIR2 family protein [Novosphingobium sp. APW14]
MRFLANGPSIPDELLVARDAGDVVFFCGAGVSRHLAKLPDFLKLGGDVITLLGASEKSLARKLFRRVQSMAEDPIKGVGSLIATDRIFSLLEREFEREEICNRIAIAIKPAADVDLSAHRTLLDLSRGPHGQIRLVTTNFDLLFEACVDDTVPRWGPPALPNAQSERFSGIVHLHGRVDTNYAAAGDDEFIVSSGDFGRAYLSDGWATRFMQGLLARFQIVFVGYAADDPPVSYLLEALNLRAGSQRGLYAFQSGINDDEKALWWHRGVHAIEYEAEDFTPLWGSLALWADRARDSDVWHDRLLAEAAEGPAALEPHRRGQIAHMLRTREGTRRISIAEVPLPASWLLALDPSLRFEKAGAVDPYDESSERIDPYESLSFDFDIPPQPADDDLRGERKIPEGSWDAFLPHSVDSDDSKDGDLVAFCGRHAGVPGPLNNRLHNLAIWFARIAHDPIALWWAAGRGPLHPQMIESIRMRMRQEPDHWTDEIRRGWQTLFRGWSDRREDTNSAYFLLSDRVAREGWSDSIVRDYADIFKPQLIVKRRFGIRHPLTWTETDRPNPVLAYGVDYPHPYDQLPIPDTKLSYAITRFRENLDLARSLEAEISGGPNVYLTTTRADDGAPPISFDAFGLTGPVALFQQLMDSLAEHSPEQARTEIARWPADDDHIYARLRIWAASKALLTPSEAADMILGLSDRAFWDSEHQRDLLFAIRDRWEGFTHADRVRIEDRILTTTYPWTSDTRGDAEAHYRLDRLFWLDKVGVRFSFDLAAEMVKLRTIANRWTPRSGDEAANSTAPEVHSVETDANPRVLEGVPLAEVLDRAREAGQSDFFDFVEHRPFSGLADTRPKRALAVLSHAARRGEVPANFWAAFLYAESREADDDRLVRVIAGRLASLPVEGLSQIAYPVSEWLRERGAQAFAHETKAVDLLWPRLMIALRQRDDGRKRRVDSSWANDALNAPVGKLVDLLMKDPALKGLGAGSILPALWRARAEALLELPGDMRRHALVMLGHRTTWLFYVDPAWTKAKLLTSANLLDDDGDAFWDGLLWAARAPSPTLFERLKPSLTIRATSPTRRRAEANVIGAFLLIGWGEAGGGAPKPLISDAELRTILVECDDDLRGQVLWHMEHWSVDPDQPWRARLLPFLVDVWPYHRAVRTAEMSVRLADLALSSGDLFPQVVTAILTRLVPIRNGLLRGFMMQEGTQDHPAIHYPAAMLDLLWAILAEDVAQWPYKVEEVFDFLTQAEETRADPRLSELRRRRLS